MWVLTAIISLATVAVLAKVVALGISTSLYFRLSAAFYEAASAVWARKPEEADECESRARTLNARADRWKAWPRKVSR